MAEDQIAGGVFWKKDFASTKGTGENGQYVLAEIIDGCRNNEASCQEKLYKKFYGYALAVALSYCYNREDAVEVVNDSFIKIFKNIKTFIPSEPFRPWLRTIVVRTSIDKVRAKKRFQHHLEIEEAYQVSPVDAETALTAKQIYALLNELPDVHRLVFNMYEMEGYSHREIAGMLDIAESSSRTYLTRAKARLRLLYKKIFTDTYER